MKIISGELCWRTWEEVREGRKAVLQEVGPFTYRSAQVVSTHSKEKYTEKHERIIIVRKSDDKTRIHKEGVGRMSYGLTR